MTERVATVRGIPIHYQEVGTGRPVLALHGFGLEHRMEMAALEPIFTARAEAGGWRRIYPDMPGHGATPGPDWLDSEDLMLDVLVDLASAVAPDGRLVIVGASWGAYMAHALAARRPEVVDGLLLRVPVVRAERARRDLPQRTVLVSDPDAVAAVRSGEEMWLDISVVQTMPMLERFRAVEPAPPDEPFLERLEPRYALSFEAELTSRIEAPALIIAGRQDTIVGYRDAWPLLEHLPRATFAVLDRAGHAVEDEQLPLFRALAHEWLDRVVEHISHATQPGPG